jgi:hypothetical protein
MIESREALEVGRGPMPSRRLTDPEASMTRSSKHNGIVAMRRLEAQESHFHDHVFDYTTFRCKRAPPAIRKKRRR